MCGIAGFIHNAGVANSREILAAMLERLRHRGPDDEGVFFDNRADRTVALGHRRLSIIDLSSNGRQPLGNEDGSIQITYNGEIYNFAALRSDLQARGHRFRSNTDTEVIVHGYEEYGVNIVERLNGMFAFALWDAGTRTLFMARDRYGQKPLYYAPLSSGLAFASELKALCKHPQVSNSIDPAGLSCYLLFEYLPRESSIMTGVRKLAPGHLMTFKAGKVEVRRYWQAEFEPQSPLSFADAKREFTNIFTRAVERHLVSDVPLGVFLSGGMDSSSLVAAMTECVTASRINTFSIGFKEASFDESSYARQVARHFGVSHHEERLSADTMREILPEVIGLLDEPFADASVIPTYLLSRFTRRHVTVALGGDGGDELLAGYDPFEAHKWACVYERLPALLRRGLIEPLVARLPVSHRNMSFDFKARQFIKGMGYPRALRNQVWLGAFSFEEQKNLLAPEVLQAAGEAWSPYGDITKLMDGRKFPDNLAELIYLYSNFYLAEDILAKVDRASMAVSLEVRAPFLDVELAEFINRLPSSYKMHGFKRKHLLKEAMKHRLPKRIMQRPKKGFGIPLAAWLRAELKPMMQEHLNESRLKKDGLFNHQFVQRLIHEHLNGTRDHRKQLWTLLVFQMWQERKF